MNVTLISVPCGTKRCIYPLGATLSMFMDKEKSKKKKREKEKIQKRITCRFSVQLHSFRISRLARRRLTCRNKVDQSTLGSFVAEPVKLVERYAMPASTESHIYCGNPWSKDRYNVRYLVFRLNKNFS